MYKILDRYILFRFLNTFLFVNVLLTVVICAIDYTEKNDQFLKTMPTGNEILFDYYLNIAPYWINMLSPITVFIAAIFVTARMASHSEIISMLSGGVSFLRFLVPYSVGSLAIGAIIFVLGGWIIPTANQKRIPFENKYLNQPFYFDGRNVHIMVAPNVFAYMESYNNTINEGYQFTLETIIDRQLKTKLKAEKISWVPETGRWRLTDYRVHKFDDLKEEVYKGGYIDTLISLNPDDFQNPYQKEATFTLDGLTDHINMLKLRGSENVNVYRVEWQSRVAYPFTILILALIGVMVSARKAREGTGFKIALGFLLAFVYILMFILLRSVAVAGGLPPFVGVWLPTFIFMLIGVGLYFSAPK